MKTASWHCHHEQLCEWDTEPRASRIAYIKSNKPKQEQELRLRLYQPMSNDAIKLLIAYALAVKSANDAYDLAMKSANDALALAVKSANDALALAMKSASDAYDLAVKPARDALEAQHELECPNCPWNGVTIFP